MSLEGNHSILDIETLSTSSRAIVASIAIVNFEIHDSVIHNEIQVSHDSLDVTWQFYKLKREIDISTVKFWLGRSKNAQDSLLKILGKDPISCEQINQILSNRKVWGNGSTFDNVILRDLMNDYGVPLDVSFRDDMDLRTLLAVAGGKDSLTIPKFVGEKHNAERDARHQFEIFKAAYNKINKKEG